VHIAIRLTILSNILICTSSNGALSTNNVCTHPANSCAIKLSLDGWKNKFRNANELGADVHT